MANKTLYINVKQRGSQQAEAGMRKLGSSIASTIGQYVALGVAVQKVGQFFKSSIELYAKQELAEKKLATALGHTSKFLLRRASELQQLSTYGDEQIIEAQALIGSFIKEESAIDAATKATLDLAAAKNMDLRAAADLVSKTLGSTTNALSRYGIQVDGAVGSTERLKSMTENIAKVFGGQAQEQAKTMSGRMQQLSNSWGDLKEKVGEGIIQLTDADKAISTLSKNISELNKATEEGGFAKFITELGKQLRYESLIGLGLTLEKLTDDSDEWTWSVGTGTRALKEHGKEVEKVKTEYQKFVEEQQKKAAEDAKQSEFMRRYTRELMIQQGVWKDINITIKDTILPMATKGKPLELFDVTKLKAADGYVKSVADSIAVKYQKIAGMAQNLLGSAFTAAFTQGESAAEAFFNSLKRMILNLATQTMVYGILSNLFSGFGGQVGGLLGFLGFRQSGGPVERGRPYVVGESGPEIIIPRDNATVIPNDKIGTSINITFTGPVTDKQFVDSFIIPRIKKAVKLGKV